MHLLEYFGLLTADMHTHIVAQLSHLLTYALKRLLAFRCIGDHHHIEVILHNRLRNVENVDFLFCKVSASFGENSNGILANDSNDYFFHREYYIK